MKKLFYVILICILSMNIFAKKKLENNEYFDVVVSSNTLQKIDKKLDLNNAKLDDLKRIKISSLVAKNIMEYKKITGGFEKIDELKRIKGIGPATYKKIKDKVQIKNKIKKNKVNINKADEKILKYYGFNKKQIKSILKYRKKHKKIKSNLELKQILDKKTYEKYKKLVIYNKF